MTIETRIIPIEGHEPDILRLLGQLNPSLSRELLAERLHAMKNMPYILIGAFINGVLVGLTGCWEIAKIFSGKQMEIDNFVIDEAERKKGIGAVLIKAVLAEGKRRNCSVFTLNAYVQNIAAHDFYKRQGFEVIGNHFILKSSDK